MHDMHLMNVKAVCARLAISRTAVYEGVRDGRLPAPIYPAPRAPRWRSDEIENHLERLSRERAVRAA